MLSSSHSYHNRVIDTPHPIVQWGAWLTMVLSSVVMIEPSPYEILLVSVTILGFFVYRLEIPRAMSAPLLLLGVYLMSNYVAATLVEDPMTSVKPLAIRTYLVVSWVFFSCIIAAAPSRIIDTVANGYMVSALIATAITYLAYNNIIFSSDLVFEYGGTRVKGTFKDPNVFGPFLVPVALFALARLDPQSLVKTTVYAGIFSAMLIGIVYSFSRGAWLNFVVALSLFTLLRTATLNSQSLRRWSIPVIIMALLGVGIFALALSTSDSSKFISQRLQVQEYDLDIKKGRFARQSLILSSIGEYPLGAGPGNIETAPHNIFLHITGEAGIIGGLAFILFVILSITKAYQYCFERSAFQPLYIAVFSVTIGTLIQSLFIDSTHWRHLYVLFSMLWGPLIAVPRQALFFEIPQH